MTKLANYLENKIRYKPKNGNNNSFEEDGFFGNEGFNFKKQSW